MRFATILLPLLIFSQSLCSQEAAGKSRFVLGLSAPELLHVGFTHRIAPVSQVGLSVGAAPSLGKTWTSINFEHRLYLGKADERTAQKVWFFRQGTTYFPAARSSQAFTLNLTAGKDLLFKNSKRGITIDAGVFYLPESERSSVIIVPSLNLWPALRFEFFFGL